MLRPQVHTSSSDALTSAGVQREQLAAQLTMAMAAAHAGSWKLNLSTGEFSASDRAIELHGLLPGTHLNHKRALACVYPADRASVEAALRLTFESGQLFRHEHRVPQPDGSVRWVLSHALRQGEGDQTCVVGLVQDITERRLAEDAVRYSEQLHRIAFDQSPTGMAYVGVDGRYLKVNPAMCEITGYAAEELMGMTMSDLTHLDDRARDAEIFASFLSGGTPIYENDKRYVRKDGSVRWVAATARMVMDADGRPLHTVGIVQDITDRKRAEAESQNAQQQIATTLESITDGFMRFDRDWRMVYVNAEAERMVRLAREEMIGRSFWELFPATVGTKIESEYKRAVAQQAAIELEHYYGPLGGWYSIRGYPTPDGGLTIYFQDITVRKEGEAELRKSEARFRVGIDAVSDIVWTNDAKGMMASEQVAWGNFTGQDRESYQGYGWSNAIHPDDAQPTIDAWNEAVAGKKNFAFEHRVRRHDGQWRLCTIRAVPVLDELGDISEWVGVHTDITDRVEAENALRMSEARLSGILRRSPAGIVQTDAAGCMTLVNPRWCEMFGHSEAELLGRTILEITHPSSVAPTAAAFGRLAAGGPDFQIEKAYCRKDGSVLRAQSNVAAIRSPAGEFLGLIAVVLDISERLRSEEELRRLAAELSEADRRKDVFLATLAHELRNPLAPIRNGLQVMKLSRNNGEALEKVRAMMDRQVSQLVRLVDDLLDVSRIAQEKVELRKERVELRAVIDAAVETSRPAIEQAGHELAVVVPNEPIFVDGDPTRLAQVVSNLLNNSAKYTHRGGRILLTAGREDGTAVVSVKDDGIGIPPAMLDKVFVMFTQVDRTLEKTTGGLGIGLSLVKGLLEMHGGTIVAKSDGEGMGSEFVVRLPVVMSDVAGPDRPNKQTSEVLLSTLRRILVVDDNVDAAETLGQVLEMLGNEVRTANDGEAGVEVAAQFRPDVVLMDIGMPKLNGYEAARRIRQHSWSRGMVLVALTGWGQDDDRKKSADAGFDHHLVKPVKMDALTKLLSGLTCSDVLDGGGSAVALPSVASS